MKPILIDDLLSGERTQTQVRVTVDGNPMEGYQIAKPLNYDPEYLKASDRIEMAIAVLTGKAIAVRYFEDLSEEEKEAYVKDKIGISK